MYLYSMPSYLCTIVWKNNQLQLKKGEWLLQRAFAVFKLFVFKKMV
jgi:hypothetical protein